MLRLTKLFKPYNFAGNLSANHKHDMTSFVWFGHKKIKYEKTLNQTHTFKHYVCLEVQVMGSTIMTDYLFRGL